MPALRRAHRIGPLRPAARTGIAPSTAHRILTRHGLPPLAACDRATGEPIRRLRAPTPRRPGPHRRQALALAKAADDYGLAGEILAAMSQQAQYVAQPRRAVELARAAQSAAQRAGMPVLLTECQVMEAHGYAAQQEARACALALTRAEKSYERAADAEMPAWLDYFDEAYFAAKIAHCFRELGRGEETEQYALRSLDMDPSYRRGKTFNIAVLGTALALQGKVDEACVHVRTAIDMAVALTSSRVYRYIGDACRALSPYAAEPDVRELMEYAEDRLPDLRVREERP